MLDGSDFPKQGGKPAGVARQYCGRLGKVANCQAGMFLAYVSPLGRSLVDKRLYLPESWTSDPGRCAAAGVPEERRSYWSKTELALEAAGASLGAGPPQGRVGGRRRRLRDVAVLPGGLGGPGDALRAGRSGQHTGPALGVGLDQSGISGVRAPPQTQAQGRAAGPGDASGEEGNQYHFGMKLHIGVDSATGLVHSFSATSANVHDVTEAHRLLHGEESQVWGFGLHRSAQAGGEPGIGGGLAGGNGPGQRRKLAPGNPAALRGKGQGIDTGQEPAPESHRGWNTPFRT